MGFHDTQGATGVTEACKYNDHSLCNSTRCGCDCHRQPAITEADSVPVQTADPQLMKSCPNCNIKRPSFERFCRQCGAKLGSLLCIGCGVAGDPGDKYCYGCGMPMTKEGLAAAASTVTSDKPPATAIVPESSAIAVAEAAVLQAIQTELRARQTEHLELEGGRNKVPDEQSWQLPQGAFKVRSAGPKAGATRVTTAPFNPTTR